MGDGANVAVLEGWGGMVATGFVAARFVAVELGSAIGLAKETVEGGVNARWAGLQPELSTRLLPSKTTQTHFQSGFIIMEVLLIWHQKN